MKLLLYIAGGFLAVGVGVALIARGGAPENSPIIMLGLILLLAVAPIGAFWMMYMSIRYEKNPFPMIALALIPFTFLWYYIEHVRHDAESLRGPSKSFFGGIVKL